MRLNLQPESMTVEDAAKYASYVLWERQAREIKLLYVEEVVGYTDFIIIVSARNERHVQALSNHLDRRMRDLGVRSISREGVKNQKWGLTDFGDFIVHIFEVGERTEYDLDTLFHEAPEVEFDIETYAQSLKKS